MVVSLFPEQIPLLGDTLHAMLPTGTTIKAVVKRKIDHLGVRVVYLEVRNLSIPAFILNFSY